MTCCVDCVQKYTLSSIQDPHCMGCRATWNIDILMAACSATFIKTHYKKHREQVLLDRQKSLLPITTPLAVLMKQKNQQSQTLQLKLQQKRTLELEIVKLRGELYRTDADIRNNGLNTQGNTQKAAPVFRGHCPSSDCKGFLDEHWKCQLCLTTACKDCRCAISEDHVCDPNIVESVKALQRETRPCPKEGCGCLIYKISGCDQMFCTICHTTFSWKTGEVVNSGPLHNPHYFQWLDAQRAAGIDPHANAHNANACGNHYTRILNHLVNNNLNINVSLQNRMLNHVRCVEIPKYAAVTEEKFKLLRVDYILQHIDLKEWARKLQILEKRDNVNKGMREILEMLCAVMDDLFGKLMQVKKGDTPAAYQVLEEFEALRQFTNTELKKYCKTYSVTVRHINEAWSFVTL